MNSKNFVFYLSTENKTIRSIILFIVIIVSFKISPIGAEPLRIIKKDLMKCSLRVSPSFEKKSLTMQKHLVDGLTRLNTLFERPPLTRKPVFWLLSNESEMKIVLSREKFKLKPKQIKQALKSRVFRNDVHIAVQLDPATPNDWLLRILFTEYVRTIIDALAPTATSLRIGWFYAGLSTYMAWMVAAEQDGMSQAVFERDIFQYYGRHFNPDKYIPLQLLEVTDDWNSALKKNPAAVYSQSVLAYLYLAKLKGKRIGVLIIKNFDKEDVFGTAFERATGMELKIFEKKLKNNMYEEVRNLKK